MSTNSTAVSCKCSSAWSRLPLSRSRWTRDRASINCAVRSIPGKATASWYARHSSSVPSLNGSYAATFSGTALTVVYTELLAT
jgi:hypothetical protein